MEVGTGVRVKVGVGGSVGVAVGGRGLGVGVKVGTGVGVGRLTAACSPDENSGQGSQVGSVLTRAMKMTPSTHRVNPPKIRTWIKRGGIGPDYRAGSVECQSWLFLGPSLRFGSD